MRLQCLRETHTLQYIYINGIETWLLGLNRKHKEICVGASWCHNWKTRFFVFSTFLAYIWFLPEICMLFYSLDEKKISEIFAKHFVYRWYTGITAQNTNRLNIPLVRNDFPMIHRSNWTRGKSFLDDCDICALNKNFVRFSLLRFVPKKHWFPHKN